LHTRHEREIESYIHRLQLAELGQRYHHATGLAQGHEPKQDPSQEPAVNRLDQESSPYLRQHRHNPVDWHPWGDEALQLAKKLDKPIFLSIGYSACHWCHVMASESFSDPEVAKLMNEKFVCIKVDREERPDIDQIYMGALHAMGQQGGWPLSAWLTPDGKPFYGGTYFPPTASRGLPGFRRVCETLANAWEDDREGVLKGAGELSEHLEKSLAPELPAGEPTAALFAKLVSQAKGWYDAEHPGFASPPRYAPKFPQATQLQMLLRHGDEAGRAMVLATLRAMARGGVHDQLGGGFHRYSTDRRWLVPHFEKMLYDNALLASVYLEASLMQDDAALAAVARSTLDYLLREMQAPDGGFWSSQDAQSEGVEGKFFVWSREQVEALLGDQAASVCEVFGITAAGNWEGSNVLSLQREAPATDAFARARARLFAAREERVRPGTDDKVLESAAPYISGDAPRLKRQIKQGLERALEEVAESDPDEAVKQLLSVPEDRKPGTAVLNLMVRLPSITAESFGSAPMSIAKHARFVSVRNWLIQMVSFATSRLEWVRSFFATKAMRS